MKVVKNLKKVLAGAAFAATALTSAYAAPTTVGGVTWDPDSPLDFSSFSIAIRQTIDPVTGVVSGFGFISTMNGTSQATFCPGCELTFSFGGFTPISSNPIPSTSNSTVLYTGGFVNVYVDSTPEITNPSDPTTLSAGNTSDGNLWLSLVGHPVAPSGVTFTGTVTAVGLAGIGDLDVTGGLAQANFDTNTRPDGADFSFSNSFTLFLPTLLNAAGTGNFFSNSIAIPEPASLALAGVALLGAGLARRRSAKK
jgi:hypothetical protein